MDTRPALLLSVAACLLACLPPAHGHGFMFEPRARNVVHNSDYCPHCLAAGGPWEVSAGSTLVWPAGVHGLCGDKATDRKHEPGGVYGPAGSQASYSAGQVITIQLLITAKHGGRYTFSLCPRTDADQGCFDAHVLQRADGTGPYTWTSPQGGPATPTGPGEGHSYGASYGGYSGELYTMQYKLPDGVTCDSCTLQWWWTTGNSCDVPGSPLPPTGMSSCSSAGPYPEEFWNCADISIGGGGGGPAPVFNPTPEPTPVTPNPEPQQPSNPEPQQPSNPAPQDSAGSSGGETPSAPAYDRKINPGGDAGGCDEACTVCQSVGAGLTAAPWSCAKYVNCGNVNVAMDCAPGTLWDAAAGLCNFADQVDCGSRPR